MQDWVRDPQRAGVIYACFRIRQGGVDGRFTLEGCYQDERPCPSAEEQLAIWRVAPQQAQFYACSQEQFPHFQRWVQRPSDKNSLAIMPFFEYSKTGTY